VGAGEDSGVYSRGKELKKKLYAVPLGMVRKKVGDRPREIQELKNWRRIRVYSIKKKVEYGPS